MRQYHIIGLTGYASAGKDTVADLLATHLGFRKLAFADALRAEVAEGFGIEPLFLTRPETKHHAMSALAMRKAPREFLAAVALTVGSEGRQDGRLSPAWLDQPRSPREIMQWWGTEYRRAMNPRYWTRTMVDRIAYMMRAGGSRFVIADVRFDNEADMVHAAGGILWQVTRPGLDARSTPEGRHTSATDGAAFRPAAVISNSHDIRHLQQLVLSEFVALDAGIPGARVTLPSGTDGGAAA